MPQVRPCRGTNLFAAGVRARVDGDFEEPGAQTASATKAGKSPKGSQEDFLHGVFGILGVAQHAVAQRVKRRLFPGQHGRQRGRSIARLFGGQGWAIGKRHGVFGGCFQVLGVQCMSGPRVGSCT